MRPLGKPMIGLEAEMKLIVSLEMTIGHLIAGMPYVYATPMMVLHMEMAAASAIESSLPPGFTSVGMEVNVRHLAATPIGSAVRAIARVTCIDAKSVFFDVEAWNSVCKIGEGTHRRGIVNIRDFEKRLGVREGALA
jgi:fluoroacetyl-CoA thioesterase